MLRRPPPDLPHHSSSCYLLLLAPLTTLTHLTSHAPTTPERSPLTFFLHLYEIVVLGTINNTPGLYSRVYLHLYLSYILHLRRSISSSSCLVRRRRRTARCDKAWRRCVRHLHSRVMHARAPTAPNPDGRARRCCTVTINTRLHTHSSPVLLHYYEYYSFTYPTLTCLRPPVCRRRPRRPFSAARQPTLNPAYSRMSSHLLITYSLFQNSKFKTPIL